MSTELSIIIAIVGAIGTLSAVLFSFINYKNGNSASVKKEMLRESESKIEMVKSITTLSTKLDMILSSMTDMKSDLRTYSNELKDTQRQVRNIEIRFNKLKTFVSKKLGEEFKEDEDDV